MAQVYKSTAGRLQRCTCTHMCWSRQQCTPAHGPSRNTHHLSGPHRWRTSPAPPLMSACNSQEQRKPCQEHMHASASERRECSPLRPCVSSAAAEPGRGAAGSARMRPRATTRRGTGCMHASASNSSCGSALTLGTGQVLVATAAACIGASRALQPCGPHNALGPLGGWCTI